jgi:methionyl-tRNA formyltransferase
MVFRAVFFGTPQFAVPCLDALCSITECVGVVAQPDKPAGRGNVLTAPPVKLRAISLGIPVIQPTKVRDGALAQWLRDQRADVALVVAYGRILPIDVLRAARLGAVNVHASLLPKFRGAAPIQWSLLKGESRTGVTLMQMDEGMDTGAILSTRAIELAGNETSGTLTPTLSTLGAALVQEDLPLYLQGKLHPVPQDHTLASHAPMLTKDMEKIDWARSATELDAQVRGLDPWPGTATKLGARRVLIHSVTLEGAPTLSAGAPGEVVRIDRDVLWIATGKGALGVRELQLEGKKRLGVHDFLVGHPLRVGTLLGESLS